MKNAQVKELQAMVNRIGGISFVGLTSTNQNSETSKRVLNVGVEHKRVLTKDLDRLEKIYSSLFPVLSEKFGEVTAQKAFDEVKKSILTSLDGTNKHSQGQCEAYLHICKGLKLHIESGKIYLTGYNVRKTVLVKGVYKKVKSRPLTLAKNEIDKYLKRNKYRMFILDCNLEKVTIMGKTLLIAE